MVECPLCGAELDVEEEELDEGDLVSCGECGRDVTVVGLNPLEFEELEEDDDEEEEEEEFDEADPWKSFRGY